MTQRIKPHITLHVSRDLRVWWATVRWHGAFQYSTKGWYAVPNVLTDVRICERMANNL